MSKKSSNFAPDMKKAYQIPATEITMLMTARLMGMDNVSNLPDPTMNSGNNAPAHHGLANPF